MIYRVFADEIFRTFYLVEADDPQEACEKVVEGKVIDGLDSEHIGFMDNMDQWEVVEDDE